MVGVGDMDDTEIPLPSPPSPTPPPPQDTPFTEPPSYAMVASQDLEAEPLPASSLSSLPLSQAPPLLQMTEEEELRRAGTMLECSLATSDYPFDELECLEACMEAIVDVSQSVTPQSRAFFLLDILPNCANTLWQRANMSTDTATRVNHFFQRLIEFLVATMLEKDEKLLQVLGALLVQSNSGFFHTQGREQALVTHGDAEAAQPGGSFVKRGSWKVSRFVVANIMCFATAGGFSRIATLLHEPNVPVSIVKLVLKPMSELREILATTVVEQLLTQCLSVVFDRLLGLTAEETKAADRGDLQSIKLYLQLLIHVVPSFTSQPLELFSLQLALKLLKSSTLEKRLAGLKDITSTLKSVQALEGADLPSGGEGPKKASVKRWLTSAFLVQWLRGERIVELVYLENVHPEILQRSADLLIFLATAKELSISDLDALWSAGEGKHESIVHIVYVLIGTICGSLEVEHIEYLFAAKLQHLPYSAFTVPTVTVLRSLSIAAISTTEGATEPIRAEDSRFHGIRFAWDLLQDKNAAVVSKELKILALAVVRDFLNWPLCYPLRETFLLQCIENLNRFTTVSVSLKVLLHTLGTYAAEGAEKIASVTYDLNEQHRLLAVVFYALTEYKRNVTTFIEGLGEERDGVDLQGATLCGTASHEETMQDFLAVLRFALCQSRLSLGKSHVDQLWACLVAQATSESDRDSAFEWLEAIRTGSNPGMAPFTVDEASHLLLTKVPTLDLPSLTLPAFEFVQGYFYFVNWSKGCLPEQMEEAMPATGDSERRLAFSSALIGLDILWAIALTVRDDKASARAVSFLCDLYKTPKAREHRDGQVEEETFISSCFSHLSSAASLLITGTTLTDSTRQQQETCVQRCLLMLKTAVEEHDATVAVPSSSGHGSLSKGAALTVKVSGAVKPTRLSVFSNDKVWHLRQLIASHHGAPVAGMVRMFVVGKELKQMNQTLRQAGVQHDFTITVALRPLEAVMEEDVEMDIDSEGQQEGPREILSRPVYFEQLFALLTLSQNIAKSTWDLIMLLPTNKQMLRDLGEGGKAAEDWGRTLDARSVYKLLYSLQILQHLLEQHSGEMGSWQQWFASSGGLAHLMAVLTSGELMEDGLGSMRRSCVKQMLQFLCQFCLTSAASASGPCAKVQDLSIGQVRLRSRFLLDSVVPSTEIVDKLMALCWHVASLPSGAESPSSATEREGAAEEAEIVKLALILLIAACIQEEDLLLHLWSQQKFDDWLLLLLGLTKNESIRTLAADAVLALCGSRLPQDLARQSFTHFMRCLLGLLPHIPPDCRSLEQLFDLLVVMVGQSFDKEHAGDLPCLPEELFCVFLKQLFEHPIVESSPAEVDHVLAGCLQLLTLLIEHESSLKDMGTREAAMADGSSSCLVAFVFHSCLFDIPREGEAGERQQPPLCKSATARTSAYDLLVALCTDHEANFLQLLEELCAQHPCVTERSEWQYSPSDQVRAPCGFVGLVNQGATCYMNSLLQQLFMTPAFRSSLLQLSVKKAGEGEPTEEERRDSVLYQLQMIFCSLQESTRRSCDTIGLCQAYRDYDGRPVNPGLQMDAEEFCNMLFDKLEMAMKATEQENLVAKYFAGELCNQVISKDCGHVSETQEPFYSLSVAVKGKGSLQESLELYVEGDMLDGDNKYHCGKCEAKVSALKRCCVRKLPETLLVHMRRFEFNLEHMQRMKVNDHCMFPSSLDMLPYTKQGLSEKEGGELAAGETKQPPEYFLYELVGVLVHTGTADSGHYYSYIKDRSGMGRSNEGEPREGGWYKFNDQIVDEWDVAQIARDCYGGFENTMVWDATFQKHVPQARHFVNNAYMLVYQRKATGSFSSSLLLRKNQELSARVWQDNEQFWRDNFLFDSHYFAMMRRVCLVPTEDARVQLKLIQLASRYYVGILCRAAEQDTMGAFVGQLKEMFSASEEACGWFLATAVDKGWVEQLLLVCPSPRTRQLTAGLFTHVLACMTPTTRQFLTVRSARAPQQATDLSPLSVVPDGSPPSILFVNQCLNLLSVAATHWRRFGQFFGPLRAFARFGEAERAYLLSVSAISRLGHFYLGDDSPFAVGGAGQKAQQMGDKFSAPRVSHLVEAIADLARSCQTASGSPRAPSPYFGPPKVLEATAKFAPPPCLDEDASVPRLPAPLAMGKMDVQMLTASPFYVRVFSDNTNTSAARSLLQHMVWNNEVLSVDVSAALVTSLSCVAEDKVTGLLEALEAILEVDDSFREARCESVMSALLPVVTQCAFPGSSATIVRYFIAICREQPVVQSWLLQNLNGWLPKWLIEHRNDQVRFAALELAQTFLEDTEPTPPPPSYEESLTSPDATPGTPPLPLPCSLLPSPSPLCLMRTRAVFQSLLLLLSTTARANIHVDSFSFQKRELQRAGTPTAYYSDVTHNSSGYKLVPYFQLLRSCLVDDSMRSLLLEMHADGFGQLYEAINALQLPMDHNKRELMLFWDCLFAATSEERLTEPERRDGTHGPMPFLLPLRPSAFCAYVTEQPHVMARLFDYFISVDVDEMLVSYNRMALPAFYRVLLRCCLFSSSFLRQLLTHKNFKWATLTLYLSIDYPEVADVIYHILAVGACEYTEFRSSSIDRVMTRDTERLSYRRLISFVKLLLVKQSDIRQLCLAKGPALITGSPDLLEVDARSISFQAEGVTLTEERKEHMGNALSVLVRCASLVSQAAMSPDGKGWATDAVQAWPNMPVLLPALCSYMSFVRDDAILDRCYHLLLAMAALDRHVLHNLTEFVLQEHVNAYDATGSLCPPAVGLSSARPAFKVHLASFPATPAALASYYDFVGSLCRTAFRRLAGSEDRARTSISLALFSLIETLELPAAHKRFALMLGRIWSSQHMASGILRTHPLLDVYIVTVFEDTEAQVLDLEEPEHLMARIFPPVSARLTEPLVDSLVNTCAMRMRHAGQLLSCPGVEKEAAASIEIARVLKTWRIVAVPQVLRMRLLAPNLAMVQTVVAMVREVLAKENAWDGAVLSACCYELEELMRPLLVPATPPRGEVQVPATPPRPQ